MSPKSNQCPICGAGSPRNWMVAPDRFHGRVAIYRLIRCRSCSLVWLDNPPKPEDLAQHYGSDYDDFIASRGEAGIQARWRGPGSVLSRYKTAGSILDIGCSSGGFLASIKGPSWKLHGIEISEAMASRARKRTGAEIFVGDVLEASFDPEAFDAITCFNLLEHTYQPRAVLDTVWKWLAPGGVFIAYLPNIDSGGARVFQSYWYALEVPRHLFHFSPKSLFYLASLAGFQDIAITTHRETFLELSARYIIDEGLRRVGLSRTPAAQTKPPGLPCRAARKLFRLTALPVLNKMVGVAGPGEIIHAVFRKPEPGAHALGCTADDGNS
jgi:SAM-dependent methyltransferase